MRIQIVKTHKLNACGICQAKQHWVYNVDVNGIIGLYCVKCDTLTLTEPIKTKYVYNTFKEKCLKIKENSYTKANNQLTTQEK